MCVDDLLLIVVLHRFISRSAMLMRQYKRTHYDVLGVSAAASQTDIREAFVKLSKEVRHAYYRFIMSLCRLQNILLDAMKDICCLFTSCNIFIYNCVVMILESFKFL